jgi:hypothetical protein
MSDAPERIVPSCVEALENYRQADMDGIMVLASRQAIHETIDAYWARVKTCEELEAKLAKAVVTLDKLARLGNGEKFGNSDGNMIARAALAEINGGGDT